MLSFRQLSVVCFRYVRPAADDAVLNRLNLDLIAALQATGRAFVSSTQLQQRMALRFCFVNWRTTAADVEAVVQLLEEFGAGLA